MSSRFSGLGATLLITGALTACENLPGAGPSVSVVEAAARPTATGETRFALVDVDPNVVAKLESAPAVSMLGTFGRQPAFATQAIGVGDIVEVQIWEAGPGLFPSSVASSRPPESSSRTRTSPADSTDTGARAAAIPEQVVGGRDGAITVPFAGRVPVVGRTPQQVEQAIIRALDQKAADPQVVVTVTRNLANTVTVIGEVTGGRRVPLTTRGDRVLDVVASAGGTKAAAHETFITLLRADSAVRLPMEAIINDPAENVYVRPGDVISVSREPQTFTAAGATGLNAMVPFNAIGITLDRAIARAGGLMDNRADPTGVFVFRYERPEDYDRLGLRRPGPGTTTQVPVVYRVNMQDANGFLLARRFPVRNKDILYVSNASATEWQKAIDILLPFLAGGTTTVSAGSTVKSTVSTPR
jgi:polysaccharide export outer membrane protein